MNDDKNDDKNNTPQFTANKYTAKGPSLSAAMEKAVALFELDMADRHPGNRCPVGHTSVQGALSYEIILTAVPSKDSPKGWIWERSFQVTLG